MSSPDAASHNVRTGHLQAVNVERETFWEDALAIGRTRIGITLQYLKARRTLGLFLLLAGGTLGTALALLLPSTYTARATFASEGKQAPDLSSLGGLGGLGALLAASGGAIGGAQTGLFVDLLKSQTFLDSLAVSTVPISEKGQRSSVRDYVVKKAVSEADRRWKARIAIRKMIDVSTQPAGIVVIRVDAKSPIAAAAIANRAVDIIDVLNLRFRRQQAEARRTFTQAFLADVEMRLQTSENQHEYFLSSNRSLLSLRSASQSPILQRQEDRMRGEVTRLRALKEQLESTIENARLTEFNGAPVLTRIDRAPPPEKRSGPPRLLIALGSVLLTATLIFWAAFIRAPRQKTR